MLRPRPPAPGPAARGLAATLAAAALTLGGLGTPAPAAAEESPPGEPVAGAPLETPVDPEDVLDAAEEALTQSGDPTDDAATEASLALLDLALVVDDLDGAERSRARSLLARPTDGAAADLGGGYRTRDVERSCDDHLCVHHVTRTSDAATEAFAARALDVMGEVWTHHVDSLGFRRPVPDAGTAAKGGDTRFDVYLADIGGSGLYGYCAPERATGAQPRVRPAYCVLDNDYDTREYGGRQTPDDNLRVTAAHEFLHAVQFGYDAGEASWLLEATATWVEERYADDVDDNRQFLPDGQVRRPRLSLRAFEAAYGNWAFFEHLTTRFGDDVVRETFERAAAPASGGGGLAGLLALRRVLSARGGDFREAYARFAADNLDPAASPYYPEGGEWGLSAPVATTATLRGASRDHRITVRPAHLSSSTVALRSRGLGTAARLRLRIDGPPGAAKPAVQVLVHRTDGTVGRRYVPLTGPAGTATVRTDLSSTRVRQVTVTVVNASDRPRDDRRPFTIEARVVR